MIDGLLDEARKSGAAPTDARAAAELLAAVSQDTRCGPTCCGPLDAQPWPRPVIEAILGADPGTPMHDSLREAGRDGALALQLLERLTGGTEALAHLRRTVANGTRRLVVSCPTLALL